MKLTEEQKQAFIEQGYHVARGLLPQETVISTRETLLRMMEIDEKNSETWAGKNLSNNLDVIAQTNGCRTDAVEAVAEQLVGPHFARRLCRSPYLEACSVSPATIQGYIPVLNFPTPGPRQFEKPSGYHIDGAHLTTLWPVHHFLVVFAYLTDVAEYGGATTIRPGSHRQVFEQWVKEDFPGSTHPPALDYAEPIPMSGSAGDVIFMHYLTVHSGSPNHDDHIRVGLNTAVIPDSTHPYQRKMGAPQPDWTPIDYTLRTDNIVNH